MKKPKAVKSKKADKLNILLGKSFGSLEPRIALTQVIKEKAAMIPAKVKERVARVSY